MLERPYVASVKDNSNAFCHITARPRVYELGRRRGRMLPPIGRQIRGKLAKTIIYSNYAPTNTDNVSRNIYITQSDFQPLPFFGTSRDLKGSTHLPSITVYALHFGIASRIGS